MKSITSNELTEKMRKNEDVIILDVRAEEKYNNYHIEEANIQTINIEKSLIFAMDEESSEAISSLPKTKEIVVACTTGNSAKKCATILAEKGYNVTLLEGGISAWKENRDRK